MSLLRVDLRDNAKIQINIFQGKFKYIQRGQYNNIIESYSMQSQPLCIHHAQKKTNGLMGTLWECGVVQIT